VGSLKHILIGLVLSCAEGISSAQPVTRPLVRFDQVEYVTCRDPGRFEAIWQSGHQQTIRLVILGDSQEMCPLGGGRVYIPRLGYEFWRRYGNVPETQFNGAGSYGDDNDASWVIRSNSGGPNPIEGRVPPKSLPPGTGAMRSHCSTNGATNLTGQTRGQMDMVLPAAQGLPADCQIPPGAYFDLSGEVVAEVFAATNASSGEVHFRARPQLGIYANYFGPITTEGDLTLGLESPFFEVKHALTPPLDTDSKPMLGVEISGDRDDKLTDILGMRLRNLSHPQGVAISPFCAGGYQASDFLLRHGNCGPLFAALDFNIAMITYGANDAEHGLTPEDFRSNVLSLMAWVRQSTGDPTFPFVLVSDCDRNALDQTKRARYDLYAAACRSIALRDSNVMAINARRMMDERGWRIDGNEFWTYVPDGVHPSPFAATILAREVVDAMLTGPSWRPRITFTPQLPPPP